MYTLTFENDIKNPNGVNIKSFNNPSSFMINSDNIDVPDSLTHSQVNNMVMIEAKRYFICIYLFICICYYTNIYFYMYLDY